MARTNEISKLKERVNNIEARNSRVEADKAWETSVTRGVLLFVVTYIAVVIYFLIIDESNPMVLALEPAAGVFLSGIIFSSIKRQWVSRYRG